MRPCMICGKTGWNREARGLRDARTGCQSPARASPAQAQGARDHGMTSKTRTKLLRQTFFKGKKYVYLESYLKIHLLRKRSRWFVFSFCAGAGGGLSCGASASCGPRPGSSPAATPAGRRQSFPEGRPSRRGPAPPQPGRPARGEHPPVSMARPAPAPRPHSPCFKWKVAAQRVGA